MLEGSPLLALGEMIPPPSSPHPSSALNLWECRHLQLPQEGGQGLLSCSWHGKLELPEIAWDCAAAKLRQPWICHLEWDKASSAAPLCLLGGCGAHPIWDPPPAPAARQGSRGSRIQEGTAANPCWMWLGILQGGKRKRGCLQNCQAESGFLAGKPKIVSLLRRGCRRDLRRSAAKYLGDCRTDTGQRGFLEALSAWKGSGCS